MRIAVWHNLPSGGGKRALYDHVRGLVSRGHEVEHSIAAMDAHCRACAQEINRGGFDILFANSCQFFRTTAIGRFATIPSVLYLQEPYRWLYEALPRLRWLARPRCTGSRLRLSTYKAAFVDLRAIR